MARSLVDPLNDGKSRIELLEWMGGDLAIANDARASFEKVSTEISDKDVKLIHYLIAHQHTSPFRGTVFKFRVKAPLFVCRQWFKHLVASCHSEEQLGWNEKSFRYVEAIDPEEFYIPTVFRRQSTDNKQATDGAIDSIDNGMAIAACERQCRDSYRTYRGLIELGVGREQARAYLVPAVYTSWVWTASLQSVLHFVGLRMGHGAQPEIVAYAHAVQELIKPIVPVAMEAWGKYVKAD